MIKHLKYVERKKHIGLHGFSRRLYKDVPDLFEVLKKLVFKIQFLLDKANPELKDMKNLLAESFLNNSNLTQEQEGPNINFEYFTHEASISNVELLEDSKALLKIENAPRWFKWLPDSSLSGKAKIVYANFNQKITDLQYHVADIDNLTKLYPNDEDVINYLDLIQFGIQNYYDGNKVVLSEMLNQNEFFKLKSKHPIRFTLSDSYHIYSVLDIIKIYFEFLVRSIEGAHNSLEMMVLNDMDYSKYHNTLIHTAIDIVGLELISEGDFYQRSLYDFFKIIQFQLDVACENMFDDKFNPDYTSKRRIIKSFGINELETENIFEVEINSTGNSNVYIVKDKRVLVIRNHLGDFSALSRRKNREYDPDIIRCYKALLDYVFKYLATGDVNLKEKINNNDYCFEISQKDPTKFHFKGEDKQFDIREVICKYIQYISASVSKITNKNARKVIVSSFINYDIFIKKLLMESIELTGYSLIGQQIFDYNLTKLYEDKLEVLFHNINIILNKNDLAENSDIYSTPEYTMPSKKDDIFSLEILSFDNVKVRARIGGKYEKIKNHIGDLHELNKIYNQIGSQIDKKKDKDDIYNFKRLMKFGFEHISKACTEDKARKFQNNFMKIKSKNPIRFVLEDSPIEYTIEDLYVKYFKYLAKTVSRKTKRPANKVFLTLPPDFNILQKSQLKNCIEKADIKCVKLVGTQSVKIMSLDFEKKFKEPGKYVLIDMKSRTLCVTLFEYQMIEDKNAIDLKNLSEQETAIRIDLKTHKKFKILSTLIDTKFDANALESSITNYLCSLAPMIKEISRRDPLYVKNLCNKIQDEFNEGKTSATVVLSEQDELTVEFEPFSKILSSYSEQANRLLEVCLLERGLSLEADIVRVDYTCRLFSTMFGDYLKSKNEPSKEKFNCIDGYNKFDVSDYLSELEDNLELVTTNLNHNIGFAIAGGIFDIHLKRNETLPCKHSKSYITAFDFQTELLFPMYMGERPLIRYCESLGQVKVKNIPRVKAGEISIELNIFADEDEKLTITAIESKNKKNLPVEFEFNEVYVSKGVQMLIDAVKFKAQDAECEKKVAEFKSKIKDVRIKYKRDYHIREEMNAYMSRLNKLKDEMSVETINNLFSDLKKKLAQLKVKV